MSATFELINYTENNVLEKTRLAADADASTTSLTVENNQNIAADSYLVLGNLGAEQAELLQVSSVSGNTAVTSNSTDFNHKKFDPITRLFGNKLRIYRASNVDGTQPDDDAFALLDTIDIDIDQSNTSYTDADGSSSYWYKYTFYNSTSTAETDLATSMAVRGAAFGEYCSIYDIRRQAGFTNNPYISDALIIEKRSEAQARIHSALSGIYTVPFTEPINPLIQQVTRLLSAGYLLLTDFGPMTNNSTADGQKMIDQAEAILEKLNTKQLVLVDSTGEDTSIAGTAGSYSGWPNGTTDTADESVGGSARSFRMSDRY